MHTVLVFCTLISISINKYCCSLSTKNWRPKQILKSGWPKGDWAEIGSSPPLGVSSFAIVKAGL